MEEVKKKDCSNFLWWFEGQTFVFNLLLRKLFIFGKLAIYFVRWVVMHLYFLVCLNVGVKLANSLTQLWYCHKKQGH